MSTTLEDVVSLTNDYVGNYSTGSVKTEVTYRAINRAIERVKRVVATPADEVTYDFWYTQDKLFYNLGSDFSEAIFLRYNNNAVNTEANEWDYLDYPHVLQGAGGVRRNRWSVTHMNGKKQLVVVGYNDIQGATLLTMDSTDNTAASDDASALAVDTITKYSGTGSLAFDLTDSVGYGTITFSSLSLDMEALFERHGFIKMRSYMTDNDIDDVTIKLQSSAGNYYTIIATLNDDGVDFVQDQWQTIAWHTDDKIAVGSPDLTAITTITLEFGLGAGFTSAIDFRIDEMFTAFAEKMSLVFFSNKKGTDGTGATTKTVLTALDDILYYSGDYDEYTDLIAQQAALLLWTQLRGDKEAYMMLKADFKENLKSFARANPRKRRQGQFRHSLKR